MTTSAPGACSAPRQRLRSALLFLQRLLHPSRLPLACSIATRWIPGALRAPAPGQGSPDSTGTPRQRSLPCSPPLFCPCGTTDSLAAPQGWVTVPCFGGHSPFSQGSSSPLQGLSPCGGCVPPPSPPLLFLPGQGGGAQGVPSQHCPPAPRDPWSPLRCCISCPSAPKASAPSPQYCPTASLAPNSPSIAPRCPHCPPVLPVLPPVLPSCPPHCPSPAPLAPKCPSIAPPQCSPSLHLLPRCYHNFTPCP